MKKYLIFLILILSHFSIYAEGVKLSCSPNMPACQNCDEYQTLFPIEEFSSNTESLDIEADNSEILNDKYLLDGNVEVTSESLYLSADDVEVTPETNSILATGKVRFQDESYLITSDLLSATRNNVNELIATASNASYQDYGAGLGGANGYTESISKTSTSVLMKNSTYSLCPVNENDWLIDADQIELNLVKNRGVADNALIKFYGVPIFYLPKYSWVLSGRGSGFLTPDYSRYTEQGQKDSSYSIRVPYYLNLAPDKDLLVALTYMSSRRFIYEGKYRQLIAPKISLEHEDSLWEIEAKYLPEDKITSLKRWLVEFSSELDISDKAHLSAKYNRVSDKKYFENIARTNTNVKTLTSYLRLKYEDKGNRFTTEILTEHDQIVNEGAPGYTRAIEGSVSKTYIIGPKKDIQNIEIENTIRPSIVIDTKLVSTKFGHKTTSKESGVRTHGKLEVSRALAIKYPVITPRASASVTNYSLKNSPNINRTIFGSGLVIDFTINNPANIFGYEVNHRITPLVTYNYRAKKIQGNIPIFDSTDKYDDIITFSDLTSGERYTGLDRITNANDITLSFESSYRAIDAKDIDKDVLRMNIAQSFYTDDEVVSDSANANYETRKSYSDIAASISLAVGKYALSSVAQFDPDKSKIVKKENKISYTSNSKKFISLSFTDEGAKKTEEYYGSYPLSDSVHFFGGLIRNPSTGITSKETTGVTYESCCWAFRLGHFKDAKGDGGYNYSTGMELVLRGLGSTSTPLKGRIESNIPGYLAELR